MRKAAAAPPSDEVSNMKQNPYNEPETVNDTEVGGAVENAVTGAEGALKANVGAVNDQRSVICRACGAEAYGGSQDRPLFKRDGIEYWECPVCSSVSAAENNNPCVWPNLPDADYFRMVKILKRELGQAIDIHYLPQTAVPESVQPEPVPTSRIHPSGSGALKNNEASTPAGALRVICVSNCIGYAEDIGNVIENFRSEMGADYIAIFDRFRSGQDAYQLSRRADIQPENGYMVVPSQEGVRTALTNAGYKERRTAFESMLLFRRK